VVRVNDRGPFHEGRVLDLSYAAAYRLGYADKGTALIEYEVLDPNAPEWVAKRRETAGDARIAAAQPAVRKTYVQAGAFRSMDGARSLQQTLASLLGSRRCSSTAALARIPGTACASARWRAPRPCTTPSAASPRPASPRPRSSPSSATGARWYTAPRFDQGRERAVPVPADLTNPTETL
jgi:hypothetical protein